MAHGDDLPQPALIRLRASTAETGVTTPRAPPGGPGGAPVLYGSAVRRGWLRAVELARVRPAGLNPVPDAHLRVLAALRAVPRQECHPVPPRCRADSRRRRQD